MRFLSILSALLFLSGTAQAQDTPSFPRWYGSLQYGRQNYQLFYPYKTEPCRTNQRRLQLSLGYQFTPRWAIQAGWGPANGRFDYIAIGTNELSQPVTESSWTKNCSSVFSTLGRYTFPYEVLKHLQFEVFAGPVVMTDRN